MSTEDLERQWGWGINVVGLDRVGARKLARIANGLDGVLIAYEIDPRESLAMYWDRSTAEEIWRRLGATAPAGAASDNLRDSIREWLDATSDLPTLSETD